MATTYKSLSFRHFCEINSIKWEVYETALRGNRNIAGEFNSVRIDLLETSLNFAKDNPLRELDCRSFGNSYGIERKLGLIIFKFDIKI